MQACQALALSDELSGQVESERRQNHELSSKVAELESAMEDSLEKHARDLEEAQAKENERVLMLEADMAKQMRELVEDRQSAEHEFRIAFEEYKKSVGGRARRVSSSRLVGKGRNKPVALLFII